MSQTGALQTAASPDSEASKMSAIKRGGRRGIGYMMAMGAMVAGINSVETISNNMVPATAKHFTSDAFLIAFIISLNRLFGILVEPYVAWKSDTLGKRRPFFMIGFPFTILSLVLLGCMPIFFQGDQRGTWIAMAMLLLLNVSLQFWQDVNWGGNESFYADTFEHERLGRAVAVKNVVNFFAMIAMTRYALKWAEKSELIPYLCSAGFIFISFLLVKFALTEGKYGPEPSHKERYNVFRHLRLLLNADLFRVAMVSSIWLTLLATYSMFLSLFATRGLQMGFGDFGKITMWEPVLTLVLSLPVGYAVDRFGPKGVLILGFLIHAAACFFMIYLVNSGATLLMAFLIRAVGTTFMGMTMTPLVFQYASRQNRGEIFGIVQYSRAFWAFVFSLVMGVVVSSFPSYEPAPFFGDDIRSVNKFAAELKTSNQPLAAYVFSRLSPEMQKDLQRKLGFEETGKVAERLAKELNQICKGPLLSQAASVQMANLSEKSQTLLAQSNLTEQQRFVLNRSLLADCNPQLKDAINYRVSYWVPALLSIVGIFLTLTMRKGKYARTIGDESAMEA